MILLIDNYDSFTYNLWHYLGEVGETVEVRRNDAITADEAMSFGASGIVISPGPCDPDQAGICLELVEKAAGNIPLMGVCLGHQSIGQAFGGKIVRAPACMHGKVSTITHTGTGLFEGIPNDFTATRYHSLTIDPDSMPDCLDVTARSEDGVIQGIQHKEMPVFGVQFHPESIASEHGHQMLKNFVAKTNERIAA